MASDGCPRYRHGCSECKFLGRYLMFDLYYCKQSVLGLPTVIARRSDDPADYTSGMSAAGSEMPELLEAKERALRAGLLT